MDQNNFGFETCQSFLESEKLFAEEISWSIVVVVIIVVNHSIARRVVALVVDFWKAEAVLFFQPMVGADAGVHEGTVFHYILHHRI